MDRLLDELAGELEEGRYRPLPARQGLYPQAGAPAGEQRPLSIPSVRDRIVQAALKIVLEPVFEADFAPVSFGFRPSIRSLTAFSQTERTAADSGGQPGHPADPDLRIRILTHWLDSGIDLRI